MDESDCCFVSWLFGLGFVWEEGDGECGGAVC